MARIGTGIGAALLMLSASTLAQAQTSRIETPLHSGGHSFYENVGVSWGLQGNGWFARFGGAPGVTPQFGGFDPAAQGRFGGGFRGGGVSGFLNFTAGQGNDSFIGGQSASVTVPNGGMGFISDTIQRPFVLGIVPVVGAEPVSPVKQALARLREQGGAASAKRGVRNAVSAGTPHSALRNPQSSADRGDLSVAEIRALQAAEDAEQAAEVETLVERAQECEVEGKLGLARVYYRQAGRHASGSRQAEINAKIRALSEQLQAPAEK
ncbi:MAG TPA: hypothetical protein VMP01_03215 [Pirellulaceae bacterium]|nr:hypothetical protein [Pirellulaceae bacterium]